jgi:hypothetical protein
VDFFGVSLIPRCFSGASQLAKPMQTSRRDFNCATWQNNIATNCPQQVNPLAWRSAECFFTARANSPRENSCKSCEHTLHT